MTESRVFAPRILTAWLAAATLTFAVSLWFMLHGDDGTTAGPSTFSTSAIGHAGFAEILRRSGVPVVISRGGSIGKAGRTGVLVVAEPESTLPGDARVSSLLASGTVLLVLPKWQGVPDPDRPSWIRLAAPVGPQAAQWTLDLLVHGKVVESDGVAGWTHNELGPAPSLVAPAQLMVAADLVPIVGSADGMLVGEFRDGRRHIWVVSDPDVIANHGLVLGNAPFALALVEKLRTGGAVVFDETIHGFEAVPANPFKLLFRKPFWPVTLQAVLATALLLWATLARFGAPEPAPVVLKSGKQSLIQNVARLLSFAGYQRLLLGRYVEATIRDVARQLRAPRALDRAGLMLWLQRVGGARGTAIDPVAVTRRAEATVWRGGRSGDPEFAVARDIAQWKQEILNGPSGSTRDHGGRPRRGAQGGRRPG